MSIEMAAGSSSNVDVGGVSADKVEALWPRVEGLVTSAAQAETPSVPVSVIQGELVRGDMQLWLAAEGQEILGCFTTRYVDNGSGEDCVCLSYTAGKDLDRWLSKALDIVEQWALSLGAVHLKVAGRKGWERRLKPYGFEHQAVILSKQLKANAEVH